MAYSLLTVSAPTGCFRSSITLPVRKKEAMR
jgi:hypothetical protein